MATVDKECKQCNKIFISNSNRQLYCSKDCWDAHYRALEKPDGFREYERKRSQIYYQKVRKKQREGILKKYSIDFTITGNAKVRAETEEDAIEKFNGFRKMHLCNNSNTAQITKITEEE